MGGPKPAGRLALTLHPFKVRAWEAAPQTSTDNGKGLWFAMERTVAGHQ